MGNVGYPISLNIRHTETGNMIVVNLEVLILNP